MMRTTDQPTPERNRVIREVRRLHDQPARSDSARGAPRRRGAVAGVAVVRRPRADRGARTYLTAAQGAIVSAAAERILPRTDTPGAIDVGVPAFIDRFYGEFMSPAEQKLLIGEPRRDRGGRQVGARRLVRRARGRRSRTRVLRSIATAQQEGRGPGSFALLRSVTILGYFTSEQVGKNVLHYDPVPGAYDGCVPIDQVGRRNWTT